MEFEEKETEREGGGGGGEAEEAEEAEEEISLLDKLISSTMFARSPSR